MVLNDKIESIGGEINAYTDNYRTSYYIKVPKTDFTKAAKILSDILINPLFRQGPKQPDYAARHVCN